MSRPDRIYYTGAYADCRNDYELAVKRSTAGFRAKLRHPEMAPGYCPPSAHVAHPMYRRIPSENSSTEADK